ncbi:hypothetical protein KEJ19_08450 [Candidatus Bathyarchaeota archaeon]|nr:hypothetical protein [Candidatus Bathyarchaeota archaeon]
MTYSIVGIFGSQVVTIDTIDDEKMAKIFKKKECDKLLCILALLASQSRRLPFLFSSLYVKKGDFIVYKIWGE